MHKPNLLKKLVKEHPIIVYYALTFLISWGGVIIILGGPGQISSETTNASFFSLYFVTVAGPSIAGVLLTGLYDGVKGYHELLSRLFKWQVQVKWYAVALLIAPLTVFTALFVLSSISPVFVPGIFSSGDNHIASMFGLSNSSRIILLLFVLMLGLFNGLIEELGWTGFVTHRLKVNNSLIASGLHLGVMWGLWHLLSNYIGSANGAGTFPLSLYMVAILFSFLPPFRIIMTWVYEHTASFL